MTDWNDVAQELEAASNALERIRNSFRNVYDTWEDLRQYTKSLELRLQLDSINRKSREN